MLGLIVSKSLFLKDLAMLEDVTNWISATSLEYWEAFAFWFQYVFPKQLHSVFLWIEQTAVWQWCVKAFMSLPLFMKFTIAFGVVSALYGMIVRGIIQAILAAIILPPVMVVGLFIGIMKGVVLPSIFKWIPLFIFLGCRKFFIFMFQFLPSKLRKDGKSPETVGELIEPPVNVGTDLRS